METWLTTQELLGLTSLPSSDRGISKKAIRENWEKRQREGVKGKTYEYAFTSLPQEVQAEYLLKNTTLPKPSAVKKQAEKQMTESAWNVLASATTEQE
ncbi:DNA-binding protein, partial [Avibacterium paragallinarum]